MHEYAATMPHREKAVLWSVSFALAMFIAVVVVSIIGLLDLPLWVQVLISAPSAVGVFQAVLGLYDRAGWNHPRLRWLHGNVLPDLSGTYDVSVTPTDGRTQSRTTTGRAEVKQSRTHICITMSFDGSRSTSTMARVYTSLDAAEGVDYQYRSTAVAPDAPDRTDHPGSARLWRQSDGTLTGDYHTGPPRHGGGTLTLAPRP